MEKCSQKVPFPLIKLAISYHDSPITTVSLDRNASSIESNARRKDYACIRGCAHRYIHKRYFARRGDVFDGPMLKSFGRDLKVGQRLNGLDHSIETSSKLMSTDIGKEATGDRLGNRITRVAGSLGCLASGSISCSTHRIPDRCQNL